MRSITSNPPALMSDYNIVCQGDRTLPEPLEFMQLIRSRWAAARIESLPEGAYSLLFTTDSDDIWGRLSADGVGIAFEASNLRSCAEFAVWLRSKLPEPLDLEFFDDQLSACVVVGSQTTAAEVLDEFGTSLP